MSVVTNWDDYEKLLHHTFYNELRVAPEEHPVLLAIPPDCSRAQKEKMLQIMFETFNVPMVALLDQALLSMYAAGRITGVTVIVGDQSTHVVPIFQGYVMDERFRACNSIGGRRITDYLMKIMTERGYSFTTTSERDIVADIKQKLCYVAEDFEEEMHISATSCTLEKTYELPDGQVLTLGNERMRAPEILFHPPFVGSEEPGISEMLHAVISSCPAQMRKSLYENVVLCGGSSMFPGLRERVHKFCVGVECDDPNGHTPCHCATRT